MTRSASSRNKTLVGSTSASDQLLRAIDRAVVRARAGLGRIGPRSYFIATHATASMRAHTQESDARSCEGTVYAAEIDRWTKHIDPNADDRSSHGPGAT